MRIADFSIRRPVFAVMLNGALVALGLVSLGRLGTDLFPRVEFPFMAVTTLLEGATPETVESEVSDPIEEQLNTIGGVEELRSISSEGISQVFVQFALEEDTDQRAHFDFAVFHGQFFAKPERAKRCAIAFHFDAERVENVCDCAGDFFRRNALDALRD